MHIKNNLHLRAPGNWINDPNGFIYYKGQYHLFYQYFPYAPQWGTMHWGHAVSPDLVHWEHLGIALFPSKIYDQNGCFSGSAINVDDRLFLYYTGVNYIDVNEDNIHTAKNNEFISYQNMITSDDGFTFDNFNGKTEIIPPIYDLSLGHPSNTRDPKVWRCGDTYYMILGTQAQNAQGQYEGRVLFYTSSDALHWSYANKFSGHIEGSMWECPDLFPCCGQYVLVVSPMDYFKDELTYRDQAVCVCGSFDPATCQLSLDAPISLVDYGTDFYAPQTTLDASGRRTMIGWMRMPEPVISDTKPWNGMMSSPRIVEIIDGHIYFKLHPGIDAAMQHPISHQQVSCQKPFRLKVSLGPQSTIDIGGYKIYIKSDCLYTDRSSVYAPVPDARTLAKTPKLNGRCELDIIVDKNLIEIYVNDGYYVLSQIVYELKDTVTIKNTDCTPQFFE